mmetsp:Transcript_8998/g.14569  ORF Transcript_8998/g.14569 Transcript_8998/m.14569 type:complete len:257 (-) Transcript_8998:205-975(-)
MALRIALGNFLTPRETEQFKPGRVDVEAADSTQALSSLAVNIILDEVVPLRRVEESNPCEHDSEVSTAPSTPERKPAFRSTQTLSSLALKISLDELLTQRKLEESAASMTPAMSEGRPRWVLHDDVSVKGCIGSSHAIGEPRDEQPLPCEENRFIPKNKKKSLFTGMPSRGSKNHSYGKCRPCKYVQAGKECPHGVLCNFCHVPHREIRRKVRVDCAFLTSQAPSTDINAQCEPCLGILADNAPWYIQLPRAGLID